MNSTIKLKVTICSLAIICLASCSNNRQSEKTSEWKSLFNGKDLTDWVVKINHHDVGENFGDTFRVEDGIIKVRYDKYDDFNQQFGHIYYKTPVSNFHLKLDYRFSGEFHPSAPKYAMLNSGVMFHSQSPYTMNKDQNWPISVEMQFLAEFEKGQPRPTGNMCSPGTEIYLKGEKYGSHCLLSSSETIPVDEWVTAELIVKANQTVQHIINGKLVLEYENPEIGGGVIKGFKPEEKIDGKALTSGFIALQSEGQPVEFRNIMIKQL